MSVAQAMDCAPASSFTVMSSPLVNVGASFIVSIVIDTVRVSLPPRLPSLMI